MDNAKPKILIVDDNMLVRMLIKEILEEEYAIAGEAKDGEEAVELYQTLKPDLTIMDIKMPTLNGFEALKKIIALDPAAKIIMLTATTEIVFIDEVLKAGAKDYLVKPIDEEKFLKAVAAVLS